MMKFNNPAYRQAGTKSTKVYELSSKKKMFKRFIEIHEVLQRKIHKI